METPLHQNELEQNTQLVTRLLADQFPRFAELPIQPLDASGSSNRLYRLGDELLVRLPRQPGGSASITKEQVWLPLLRNHLPLEIPEIIQVGEPAFGYSERWSIVKWIDGQLPSACAPADAPAPHRTDLAIGLAEFILALRSIEIPAKAKNDAPLRWYRGRSLAEFDPAMRRNLRICRTLTDLDLDLDQAVKIWDTAMRAPDASRIAPDRWYHSDLVAENLLTRNHHLTGVLDFGGLAIGDPTIDLHGAWEVLDAPARDVLRRRLGVNDADWLRGRAWALAIALGTFAYYWNTMPGRIRDRLAMARSVLADTT